MQKSLNQIGKVLQEPQSEALNRLNETVANLELSVNIEQPEKLDTHAENSPLEATLIDNTLATFAQNLESFILPLIETLQSNKALDAKMLETLQDLNLAAALQSHQPHAKGRSETHVQKISRELTDSKNMVEEP